MTEHRPLLTIPNWKDFQHYKDRGPLWIKNYTNLLRKFEYAKLSETGRAHIHALWLLAANYDGVLPFDPAWISSQILAVSPVNYKELVDLEWITLNAAASNLLATCYGDASLHALARVEKRREEKRRVTTKARATRLPDGFVFSESVVAWAAENHPSANLDAEIGSFTDHHSAKGSTFLDWDAAARNWIRNSVKFAARAPRLAIAKDSQASMVGMNVVSGDYEKVWSAISAFEKRHYGGRPSKASPLLAEWDAAFVVEMGFHPDEIREAQDDDYARWARELRRSA